MKLHERSCFLIVVVALVSAISAWSMEPPRPGEIEALRASGELANRLQFAYEIGNHRFSNGLVEHRLLDTHQLKIMAPPPWRQGMPTTGSVKILALLIEFSDMTHSNLASSIDDELFGAGDVGNYPYESLANYYDRSSYSQLDLSSGNTLGWYNTAYPRGDVVQTRTGRENLIKEVLNYYDDLGHNFS
jgi:hypothetical protein